MYAVVEAGGRQYQLTSGRYVDVEMVAGDEQSEFVFDRVLMIVDGDQSMVGKPVVDGARVVGKIIGHGRNSKLVVYKYRAKKGTRKRTGHRQGYTRIFIDSIKVNDKTLSEAKDERKSDAGTAKAEKQPKPAVKSESKAVKAEKAAPKKTDESSEPKKPARETTKKEEQ